MKSDPDLCADHELLRFSRVFFRFSDETAEWLLHDFSLTLFEEEVVVLLGPSGCGKTTLLNLMARVLHPKRGLVAINGLGRQESLTTGMVFQSPTLLPWRTVLDNAAFGLELRGSVPAEERRSIALEALTDMGLADYAHSYPHEISGGMQQRVALLRAVMPAPRLLLLDEPFSSLDFVTKRQIHIDLSERIEQTKCLTVLVTHDLEDTLVLGDRVIVLGRRPLEVVEDFRIAVSRGSRLADDFDSRLSLAEHRARIWRRWTDVL